MTKKHTVEMCICHFFNDNFNLQEVFVKFQILFIEI